MFGGALLVARLFGIAGGQGVLWDAQQDMDGLADIALFPVGAQNTALLGGQLIASHVDAQQEAGGDVRRDADGGEDIRVRAIDALFPIGDTAVADADPRCKLLLTQMAFFPIFSDPTTDLVFHTVTAFSSDTGKNGNSN